ncbi:aminoglycoside phosphotransferase family protein [Streptomyces sp. NPDC056672]|uniref:aminoglycoside phosphotransferase family protein n=1 Tax=Streptomyces sp. NPDC056672 TaxID=3345906 RepID=UPI00367F487B
MSDNGQPGAGEGPGDSRGAGPGDGPGDSRGAGPADGPGDGSTGLLVPPIDTALVRRLVGTQFPRWSGLPVRPVAVGGNDNRTFHLGDTMTVRLPSGPGYAGQVGQEQRWMPFLAPRLPLPVPVPLAKGAPGEGYPMHWSVYPWLEGESADAGRIDDLTGFAVTLAGFLNALARIDASGGPPPASHSGFRGAPPSVYDEETRRAIGTLGDLIDGAAATAVWEAALAAVREEAPVWFHGDVAAGNLLVRDGRLAAVIDFGCFGVGDPACDVVIAWTLLSGPSRKAFRAALRTDHGTWVRGRGWALWKALITWVEFAASDPARAAQSRRIVEDILHEHEHESRA